MNNDMIRLYIIHAILLISVLNVFSQNPPVSLKECIEAGLENNYSIRIIQNEARISSNNATPGNAGYLPTIDLSGGLSGTQYSYEYRSREGASSNDRNINNETANIGVNLNWTLFDGFGIQADYNKLKELELMGQLNTRIAIENLTANIAAEYYNLIRQRIRLNNLRSAVRLSRERLRIVEDGFIVGFRSGLEVQQATVYFNSDSSRLVTQNETVKATQIRLNKLMGLDEVTVEINVKDTIPLNTSLAETDLWNKTFSENSYLLSIYKNKAITELDYQKIRSRNYPYLRINGGYGYTANWYESGTTELQQRIGMSFGLTVGYTLFNGMNRQREQRNARIQLQNSELRIQDLELGLKADLANLWMAYQNNLDLKELEKKNLVVAVENYAIANERFLLGELAGIDLREAQNSLLESQERLSIAEYNTKLCEISLLQLSGQILNYLSE
jgi:outer membrane protein TolC